jgi:hypothetical protein
MDKESVSLVEFKCLEPNDISSREFLVHQAWFLIFGSGKSHFHLVIK